MLQVSIEIRAMTDWDEKHREQKDAEKSEPAQFLVECEPLLPRGSALDLAMGMGRNSFFLAAKGFSVVGIDRSEVAVSYVNEQARLKGLPITAICGDLERMNFTIDRFDVVIVFYYLLRDTLPLLKTFLKEGGALVYETYTVEHSSYQAMNAGYLLKPNELLHAFGDLRIVIYREINDSDRRKATASLLAFENGEFTLRA
jgi:tellurite methyltransferase